MTYEEYSKLPGLRATQLKLLDKSPLHCHAAVDDDTSDRTRLRAMHCMLLEPENFDRDFAYYSGSKRSGSKYDAWAICNEGRQHLLESWREGLAGVVEGVRRHKPARDLLTNPNATTELTVQWTHPETGVPCKARLDLLVENVLADLKGYGTANPREIGNRIAKLGAHIQFAHYEEGCRLGLGVDISEVLVLSYETRPPYDAAVVRVDIEHGRKRRDELMRTYADCLASGDWPGQCPDIVDVVPPVWDNQDLDLSDLPEDDQ